MLVGNPCLVECINGQTCREFGKHFCLCPKGKKGKDCKENGKSSEGRRIFWPIGWRDVNKLNLEDVKGEENYEIASKNPGM